MMSEVPFCISPFDFVLLPGAGRMIIDDVTTYINGSTSSTVVGLKSIGGNVGSEVSVGGTRVGDAGIEVGVEVGNNVGVNDGGTVVGVLGGSVGWSISSEVDVERSGGM